MFTSANRLAKWHLVLTETVHSAQPDLANVRSAAASIAMAWFLIRGFVPSIPVEPCKYDLVVDIAGQVKRVQVKTITGRSVRGNWDACISRSARPESGPRLVYDPDDFDLYFIIDGDMCIYLIPMAAVAGKTGISLKAYAPYQVGSARSLLESFHPSGM